MIAHGGDIFRISLDRGWDWRDVADFSASINPLGPAPGVVDAIRGAVDRITHYPEREPARLRRALAELWSVDEDQLMLGNGAAELLHFFARITPHEEVTLAVPVFSEFHRAYTNARCVAADRREHWPSTGLLVLTQPNNPTGAALPSANYPEAAMVDESFLEFTELPSAARTLEDRRELVVLRSLTKFYALPGLRIGAMLANTETVARWRCRREPWQVNVLAEEAALAAIADREHARRSLDFVRTERTWLAAQIASLPGVCVEPSSANYLFVRLDYPAARLCSDLLESKILVRACTGTPGVRGEAVRVAVRPRAENERLIAAWKEFAWPA